MRVFFTIFFAFSLSLTAQPKKGRCVVYRFVADLKNGHQLEKPMGSGLVLRFKGEEDSGWRMTVDDQSGSDRIYPANPPIRFNALQQINASYGQNLRDQVSDRKLFFIWKDDEFERMTRLITDALWPYNAPDPDHAGDRYLSELARVSLGQIELHRRSYEVGTDGVLKAISYEVKVVVPAEFKAQFQKSSTTECPVFRY